MSVSTTAHKSHQSQAMKCPLQPQDITETQLPTWGKHSQLFSTSSKQEEEDDIGQPLSDMSFPTSAWGPSPAQCHGEGHGGLLLREGRAGESSSSGSGVQRGYGAEAEEMVPWKSSGTRNGLRTFRRKKVSVSAAKCYLSPPRLVWPAQCLEDVYGLSASSLYLRLG